MHKTNFNNFLSNLLEMYRISKIIKAINANTEVNNPNEMKLINTE